ncbi:FecR family protein [Methylobacterium sp. R2-1]|uniref:FecR family protein n=1 Tax=Methylobacterium sp. R2-1 TaxID=2587064 RepID=UPI00161073F0|nr:FecR domain-containing protein [Methylobacterium sp. R2-1]MBB2962842.1 transmembrane sensor [Methylobacterium sp. R2-1]
MNEREPPDASEETEDDPVYEEAALWVARLSSADATEADRTAFEAWRAADPAHAEAFAEMDAWRRTMKRAPDPRQRRVPKGLTALAAAIGLAGLLGDPLGWVDRMRADAWTDRGRIEMTTLPDGSRVDLNTDTALALRFTPGERGVALLRGEAVFDVVPDAGRPFIVRGNGVRARAVGTRFFVRVDGSAVPVGVAEGRVDVATEAGETRLQAGEVAVRGEDGQPVARTSDVARALAWREGKLTVSGQPLSHILNELERYRRGRILLVDYSLGSRRFSGTLDLRDTDAALDVLAAAMELRLTRLTPLLVLVRPAS